MAKKTPQSTSELNAHLQEQIGFLERSADAFDAGYTNEAKRLAVTIRVLVHDTRRSHSLLSQLDQKNTSICDSSFDYDPNSLIAHAGLAGISVNPPKVEHAAPLDGDDPSRFRWVDFEKWWNAVIFVYDGGRELTRKELVLAVSNQDGGAHVDPALDEDYARLSRQNALGRFTFDEAGEVSLCKAELVSVRQIAHELLKSLKPGYTKKPSSRVGVIIGSASVQFIPAEKNAAPKK